MHLPNRHFLMAKVIEQCRQVAGFKDPVRRRQWVQAIHQEPTPSSRICGKQVVAGLE